MSREFNLFLLHTSADIHPRTWICVQGEGIKQLVDQLEKSVLKKYDWSREKLSRNIAVKFNCAHGVIKRILQGKADFYPLPIILEMARLRGSSSKILRDLQRRIAYLKVNSASSKPIKAVRALSDDLAKILGAFMADGSLSMQFVFSSSRAHGLETLKGEFDQDAVRYSGGYIPSRDEYYVSVQASRGTLNLLERIRRSADMRIQAHYSIELTEEYKDSVEAFNGWIKKEFDIQPTSVTRKKGAWRTIFSNKILARYLISFFEVKPGPKTFTAHEPYAIRISKLAIRKGFARGALMFDGCVGKSGKMSFSSKSRNLHDAIKEIWQMDGISFGEGFNAARSEFSLATTERNDKKRFFAYFEPDTQKYKLLLWLRGDVRSKPILKKVDGLSAENLLKVIKERRSCDINYLAGCFKRSRTVVQHYIRILERQKKIRVSRNPKYISGFVSANTEVVLDENLHDRMFAAVRDVFGRDKNLAQILDIHKATFSAWRNRKNRIPLEAVRKISQLLDLDYEYVLRNVSEADRQIVELRA